MFIYIVVMSIMEVRFHDLVIEKATEADFDGVVSLLHQLWPGKDLESKVLFPIYASGVNDSRRAFLVARAAGKVVGFGCMTIKNDLWVAGNLAYVDELVVDEAFRGRGIGTRLMEEMVLIADEHGCKKIELDSAFHRVRAHEFYRNLGFEKRSFVFSKDLGD